jgi:hypothetical protein
MIGPKRSQHISTNSEMVRNPIHTIFLVKVLDLLVINSAFPNVIITLVP